MRIFLDANILFSAAKSAAAVRHLLDLLMNARHECWADSYVAEEARRNLGAKAPNSLPFLEVLLERMHVADAPASVSASKLLLSLPEKDRPVLDAAIRLKCDALMTGDRRHFGHLYGKKIAGVAIHSPRSLAETLLA